AAAICRELAQITSRTPRPLLELADDNTFAGNRDPHELFDALSAAGARYFTEADWRIGERPEVLSGLAASGCAQVLMGIESLVFRYPGMGAKQTELRRIVEAVERVQAAGVAVNGCFIVGAEGETRGSLDRLANFILDSPLAEVQLTLQTPFPGTGLYRRLRDQGRLLPERDWSHYTLFDVTYQPDAISVAELEQGFRDVVQAVFSQEAAARRSQNRRAILRRRKGTTP
ncbi:MAG TPA: B12-binding domain-containing radical SAM protein, partial [Pirellulaceae bacterium]|nr:B12-binding domain-containing radical SAM protein [Pirellulaceae bacterium]